MTERRDLVERIWSRDPTVWTGRDEARWLGWLDGPSRMSEDVDLLLTLADDVAGEGDVDHPQPHKRERVATRHLAAARQSVIRASFRTPA